MPRDKIFGERFHIKKFKWYLVDLRDYHKPVLVRKHLDSKAQAIWFRDKYYDKNYDVIYWKKAEGYDLRDYINKHRRHGHHTAKYDYPPDCKTQHQRQVFRNNIRKKNRQRMRAPKVTETILWEIIDDKPVLFVKRVSHYADNHWVYSQPVEGLKEFEKYFSWPKDLRHLCNIVRTLNDYYEVGLYPMAQVALGLYKKWGPRIRRHCDRHPAAMSHDEEQVVKELEARGFQYLDDMEFFDEDSYVATRDGFQPAMAHPELCWHTYEDKKLYDHYVYDFQAHIGIPGYCKAHVAGLRKRM